MFELEDEASDGAGEIGKTGDGGTRTGKAVVEGCEGGEVDDSEDGETMGFVDGGVTEGIFKGRPDAVRALTTASQPASRVLILSLSSSFSLSLALSL